MASLDQYPVSVARDFIFGLNDRLKMKDGSIATSATVYMTVEDARLFYAAMKWIELLQIQGSSVQNTRIPFRDCVDYIKAKAESLKNQKGDERILKLDEYGVKAMKSIEIHIDQLSMTRDEQASNKKRTWKKR